MILEDRFETWRGEGLKTVAEDTLGRMSESALGSRVIEVYAHNGGSRIIDDRLNTSAMGVGFENPIVVGAGWDKRGVALNGLWHLGFSGVEAGTVPLFGQPGNPQPRLWTMGANHEVGRNALGFNSQGCEPVERELESYSKIKPVLGVNIGKNKLMPDERSPWAHREVAARLNPWADYFVFNPSSPNTPGLRDLQGSQSIIDHVEAIGEAAEGRPIAVKLAPDMDVDQFYASLDAIVESGAKAVIIANTTINPIVKRMYGVGDQPGGISGEDPFYAPVLVRMTYDAYESVGDKLDIVGVGAVSSAFDVLERMIAGASIVQVVTAIRQSRGKVAAQINKDLVSWLDNRNVDDIRSLIGIGTKRGAKYPSSLSEQ